MTDTRAYQQGAEVVSTETSLATRAYQMGVEIIFRTGTIIAEAIATGEIVFALGLMPAIDLPGINTGEDVEAPSIARTIGAVGIESGEIVYDPFLIAFGTIILEEIGSAESVDPITLRKRLTVAPIESAEAFFAPLYIINEHTVVMPEIAAGESFGVPFVEHKEPPRTVRYRVVKTDYGPPGIIVAEIVEEDSGNYPLSASLGGSPDPASRGNVSPVPGSSKLILLDSVAGQDGDAEAGYYAAVAGFNSGWRGALVEKSGDGGSSYDDILTVQNQAVIGRAISVLADATHPYTWDTVNTVDIELLKSDQQLNADTEENVLNGSNAGALIKSNGEVEFIQWVDAVALTPGLFRLSTLLRGRRGTDFATADHAINDRFVLMDELTIYRIEASLAEIGLPRLYKAVTLNTSMADAAVVPFTNNGASLKPLSPVHIKGTRDGSNNLTVTAIRRTRIGGEWRDSVDVSLGETTEAYEVDFLNGSTVVRTKSVSSPSVSYTAAEQTTDGLTPGDPVSLRWYQISEAVGRGFPGIATV